MGALKDGGVLRDERDQLPAVCSSEAGMMGLTCGVEIVEETPCHMWRFRRKLLCLGDAHLMEMRLT